MTNGTIVAGTEIKSEEDKKRAEHEASEAKRKAEWEARQQAKKAAEQEQTDRLNVMSDDEVLKASMKRVSSDTEKLTRRNMKECVLEYIQTLCFEDVAFARLTMMPKKSMIRCFQYISRKAWEYVQDEIKASGVEVGREEQGYGCDVPDGLCYQWAEDYFRNDDIKEDKEDEEEFVPRPYVKPYSNKSKAKTKAKDKEKESESDAAKAVTATAEEKAVDGQISLFDQLPLDASPLPIVKEAV